MSEHHIDLLHGSALTARSDAIGLSHSSEQATGRAWRTLRETTDWLEYAARVAREKLDAGHE